MTSLPIIAAIDVGSHDIVLKIAALKANGTPKILEEVQRTIPIGADTYTTGSISQYHLNVLIDVLKSFQRKFDEYKVNHIRAVATSAFREAENQLYALEQIEHATGLKVEVLANSKDVYYHQLALSEMLTEYKEMIATNALFLNIGAGSIQLTLFNDGRYVNTQSFRLGSLRIREMLGDLERHSDDFNALMAEYITGELNYYRSFSPNMTLYRNLVILGGSSHYLRAIGGWDSKKQRFIDRNRFSRVFEELKAGYNLSEFTRFGQLATEQEMLLVPTCIVIDEVLQFTGVERFILSDMDLADGIIYEMAGDIMNYRFQRDPDLNLYEAAANLSSRYRTDKKHSRYVESLSARLFDLMAKIHGVPKQYRKFLRIAALLHNIGKYISMENDGIRSYEIVRSNALIGLGNREVELVAVICCFHNGHITPDEPLLQSLTVEDRLIALKLIALLTLANSLDAGHKQKIEILKIKIVENNVEIQIQANQDHTLETWNFNKHTRLFKEIFGLQPVLKTKLPKVI